MKRQQLKTCTICGKLRLINMFRRVSGEKGNICVWCDRYPLLMPANLGPVEVISWKQMRLFGHLFVDYKPWGLDPARVIILDIKAYQERRATQKQIAKERGVSWATIQKIMQAAGLKRKRGGRRGLSER